MSNHRILFLVKISLHFSPPPLHYIPLFLSTSTNFNRHTKQNLLTMHDVSNKLKKKHFYFQG